MWVIDDVPLHFGLVGSVLRPSQVVGVAGVDFIGIALHREANCGSRRATRAAERSTELLGRAVHDGRRKPGDLEGVAVV